MPPRVAHRDGFALLTILAHCPIEAQPGVGPSLITDWRGSVRDPGRGVCRAAVRLHPPGRIEVRLDDVESTEPRPGQVLVQVYAAAITGDELEWQTDRLLAILSYELWAS